MRSEVRVVLGYLAFLGIVIVGFTTWGALVWIADKHPQQMDALGNFLFDAVYAVVIMVGIAGVLGLACITMQRSFIVAMSSYCEHSKATITPQQSMQEPPILHLLRFLPSRMSLKLSRQIKHHSYQPLQSILLLNCYDVASSKRR